LPRTACFPGQDEQQCWICWKVLKLWYLEFCANSETHQIPGTPDTHGKNRLAVVSMENQLQIRLLEVSTDSNPQQSAPNDLAFGAIRRISLYVSHLLSFSYFLGC
jgi:hypothetical protein